MVNVNFSIRKLLKYRLQGDKISFHGHDKEWKQIKELIYRTADCGESNSALLIGPRGSGKTTLITSVLKYLEKVEIFKKNAIPILLNGLIHTDDSLALESIAVQMNVNAGGDEDEKVFGSFAENLLFLLRCLKAGDRDETKCCIFILEEFDLFCNHRNQTLLYNLFNIAQSAKAPVCVIGTTCRLDVIELLEKRVKSRFSHRQIFLFPGNDFNERIKFLKKILQLDNSELKTIPKNLKPFYDSWNENIEKLSQDKQIRQIFEKQFNYDNTIASLKKVLYQIVSFLPDDNKSHITIEIIQKINKLEDIDRKVELGLGLSVIEICLLIAMKHHSEIYDRDPFNFEMIYTRFKKFAQTSGMFQNISREVALKGFERIRQIEFIIGISQTFSASNSIKQFKMYYLVITFGQLSTIVNNYLELPTEISQWADVVN